MHLPVAAHISCPHSSCSLTTISFCDTAVAVSSNINDNYSSCVRWNFDLKARDTVSFGKITKQRKL